MRNFTINFKHLTDNLLGCSLTSMAAPLTLNKAGVFEGPRPVLFFYLSFLSEGFTNHRTAGERGRHFFNFSLPLPLASQTLRHQLGDSCKELTSAHSQQPDSNWEPLVFESKWLTTKLRAFKPLSYMPAHYIKDQQNFCQCNLLGKTFQPAL